MLALRGLVLSLIPEAKEPADPADKLIGYTLGPRLTDTICLIQPYRAHVNLGLFDGATLPDPAGLLVGTGKRQRHVRIESEDQVGRPEVSALLRNDLAARARRASAAADRSRA